MTEYQPTFRKGSKIRFEREPVDFSRVANPKAAVRVEIAFCNLTSLSGIQRLSRIQDLQIHYCRSLTDISEIGELTHLKRINLYSLPNVQRQFSVEQLNRLEDLTYNGVKQLGTIRGIESLPKLTYLGLSQVKVFDGDYAPIVESPSLGRVFWFGGPFKSPALKEIKQLRPDLLIGGNAVDM